MPKNSPEITITLDHCCLNTLRGTELPHVEKPGQVIISSNHIQFDEFIIRCESVEQAAQVAMIWLSKVAVHGLECINDDLDNPESPTDDDSDGPDA